MLDSLKDQPHFQDDGAAAKELATGAHGRQVDKIGVPYREHLRAVAEPAVTTR